MQECNTNFYLNETTINIVDGNVHRFDEQFLENWFTVPCYHEKVLDIKPEWLFLVQLLQEIKFESFLFHIHADDCREYSTIQPIICLIQMKNRLAILHKGFFLSFFTRLATFESCTYHQ